MEPMNVWLYRNETGASVPGRLVQLTPDLVARANVTWMEEFERRRPDHRLDEEEALWRSQVVDPARELHGCALLAVDAVEGLILFNNSLEPSRKTAGAWLLYVRYLAAAPWNRSGERSIATYDGVDRILAAQAVRESIRLGSPGRIGLNASSEAVRTYEDLGFDVLEEETAQPGLRYFELRPPAALQLLSKFEFRPISAASDELL